MRLVFFIAGCVTGFVALPGGLPRRRGVSFPRSEAIALSIRSFSGRSSVTMFSMSMSAKVQNQRSRGRAPLSPDSPFLCLLGGEVD